MASDEERDSPRKPTGATQRWTSQHAAVPVQGPWWRRLWLWLTRWSRWFITEEIQAQGPMAVARATALVLTAPLIVLVSLAPALFELIGGVTTPVAPAVILVISACFALAPLILRLTASARIAGAWVLLVGAIGSFIPAYAQQGLTSILMVWFLLIPMIASFLLGARWTAVFTAVSGLIITSFWILDTGGVPVMPESEAFRWLNLILALITISVMTFLWELSAERSQREREQLEAQVRHSQKLETVGMLAGGIAHDFNNILAAILGHASILEGELASPAQQRRVKAIVDSSRRAAGLVEQMLAYAGRAQTRTGAITLPRLITEVVELLSPGLDKKTELILELDHDTPQIAGDPIQIQQVVMNLITNASEALEGKRGRVWIRSGALAPTDDPHDRGYLSDLARDRPLALIEVRDEGCGIEAAKLDSIFDPFFTTKPTGHGLGLAAVLGIVRSHGGDIEVESELGRGTSFRVLLPCPDAEALAEAQAESAAPRPRVRLPTAHDLQPRLQDQPPKRTITPRRGEPGYVLIVDDEEMVRELAGEVLEAAGYRVLQARDGDEGLRVFEAQAAQIDLLVVDRTMPGLDGLELLAAIRQTHPDIPTIISSGYAEDASSKRLRQLGVDAVLHKPWSPRDLVALVRELTPAPAAGPGDGGAPAAPHP